MTELIQHYWPLLLIAFAIGLAVAWYAFMATRRTSVRITSRDVLDEGAAPARRNQALIDAPQAAGTAPPASPAPTAAAGGDDLTRIKGLGPKLAAQLNALGIMSYSQIAAWDDAEIDRIDRRLGRFQGRIRRDEWVSQAGLLAAGDETAFARRFGNQG